MWILYIQYVVLVMYEVRMYIRVHNVIVLTRYRKYVPVYCTYSEYFTRSTGRIRTTYSDEPREMTVIIIIFMRAIECQFEKKN